MLTYAPDRVLITGAGGFVGSHVLRHILDQTDWDVVVLDSFRHKGLTDRIVSAMDGMKSERVTVITHDLRVPISAVMDHQIGSIDYVLNLASESHVDRSIEHPREFVENNIALMLTMLEWLLHHPYVKKFIHISTDEVYGPAPVGHNHREGEPHRPSNPYSASKSAQEAICFSYWRTYRLPIMITNTMNLIGEMQDPEKMVPKIIKCALEGQSMPLHADAEGKFGSRFYIHARNQADALLWLLENLEPLRYGPGVSDLSRFNVVGEREIDNHELWLMVTDAIRDAEVGARIVPPTVIDFHTSRPGHDLRYALDGSKLAEYGWQAPLDLDESLRRTVQWTLRHLEWVQL